MKAPGRLAHLRAFTMPITAGVLVPWLLARGEGFASVSPARAAVGAGVALAGWAMVGWTVALFVRVGRGTLAPWDPTQRLVTAGPFAHVRNPMISGVACAIAGVAIACGSAHVALWAFGFVAVNHVYFVLSEEPGLRRRFGPAYDEYASFVPRWWPRLRPYRPSAPPG